jgi:hypothetical protein
VHPHRTSIGLARLCSPAAKNPRLPCRRSLSPPSSSRRPPNRPRIPPPARRCRRRAPINEQPWRIVRGSRTLSFAPLPSSRPVRIPSRSLTLGFGWLVCSSGAGRSEVVPAGRVEGHRGGADAAPRRPDGRPGDDCCRTPLRFAVCSFDWIVRAPRFEELGHARGMDLFV